jgi:hypothetical protein
VGLESTLTFIQTSVNNQNMNNLDDIWTGVTMELFAFMPKYHQAPDELVAVMAPMGLVTREVWEKALADRIYNLVMKEDSPGESSELACKLLKCSVTDDPKKLSEKIFLENNLLKTQLTVAGISNDHFCLIAENDDPYAKEVLENDTLLDWVICARDFVENNRETLLAYTAGTWSQKQNFERLNPQMLDKQLWPYADYFKGKNYLSFDFESSDSDEFDVFVRYSEFYFSIRHHHNFLELSQVRVIENVIDCKDLEVLTTEVKKFNRTHASKISFSHSESKKFLFKKIYKLSSFFLVLEVPLVSSLIDVEKTLLHYYSDLQSFLLNKNLHALNFSYFENDKSIEYLMRLLALELKNKELGINQI